MKRLCKECAESLLVVLISVILMVVIGFVCLGSAVLVANVVNDFTTNGELIFFAAACTAFGLLAIITFFALKWYKKRNNSQEDTRE